MSTLQVTNIKSNTANAAPIIADVNGVETGQTCRCWGQTVLASGVPSSTVGFNISSITYVSSGNWDINLTTPCTGLESFTGFITSDGNYNITYAIIRSSSTSTKIRIWCKTNSNVFYNPGVLYYGFFW